MCCVCFFFFKQKTAYEVRISDWISDVCSSDLEGLWIPAAQWELRVDRESAYSAIGGMPLTGDAIISNNVSGLIAIRNGAQAYVSLTGDLMPEPNWADSFVGFRKWEIIHWPTEGGDAETLAERDPPP